MRVIPINELLHQKLSQEVEQVLLNKQQRGQHEIAIWSQDETIKLMIDHIDQQYHGNITLAAHHWDVSPAWLCRIRRKDAVMSNHISSFLNRFRLPPTYEYMDF